MLFPKNLFGKNSKKTVPTARWYAGVGMCLLLLAGLFSFKDNQRKILVFSRPGGTEATRLAHLDLLRKVAESQNIALDTVARTTRFSEDSLKQYNAVVFLHTPPTALDYRQQADLERFTQAGGSIMALNAGETKKGNFK
jgi:cytochrome c